jgi:hypothetical protein
MRIFSSGSIPLFLPDGRGKVVAQLESFDVMYVSAPAIGFDVQGCLVPAPLGFFVEAPRDLLLFLTVIGDADG